MAPISFGYRLWPPLSNAQSRVCANLYLSNIYLAECLHVDPPRPFVHCYSVALPPNPSFAFTVSLFPQHGVPPMLDGTE